MTPPITVEVWNDPVAQRQEVHVNGELICDGTHAEHGWHGLHLQAITAERLASAIGAQFRFATVSTREGR